MQWASTIDGGAGDGGSIQLVCVPCVVVRFGGGQITIGGGLGESVQTGEGAVVIFHPYDPEDGGTCIREAQGSMWYARELLFVRAGHARR